MMRHKKAIIGALAIGALFIFSSCGDKSKNLADRSSGDMEAYESSDVNGVTQALPTIMILPADQTLQNFRALQNKKIDGKNFVIRNYDRYLQEDDRFRRISATIQDNFNRDNYPLQDFEQTLKQINTTEAIDMADDLQQDAKTLLLQTAQPDIILDLNYHVTGENKVGRKTSGREKNISYTLSAIDAYTNKVVGTITESNMKGNSTTETIQESLKANLPKLKTDIVNYFSNLQTRGREVTLRITVAQNSNQNLSDESIEGDTYADFIVDYVKTHTVKGAFKLQTNTKDELYFVNVRIPMVSKDGTQYGVYDWTRDLIKTLRKDLGIKAENKSQGLGQIYLTIQGM